MTRRLSKTDQIELAAHNDWKAWGKIFGWELYGSTGEIHATFIRHDGEMLTISGRVRQDIDAVRHPHPGVR